MDVYEELEVAYELLGILTKYAPDRAAQMRCAEWYNTMRAEGETPSSIVRALVGCIHDGKCSGNWPWVIDPEGRY